jgi:eukaryotic-like serine/threonine-protein kinase
VPEPTVDIDDTAHDDGTELGTEAATPKAIADAVALASAHEQPGASSALPRLSGSHATPSLAAMTASRPTAAAMLDRTDLKRSRMFHVFGITAPVAAAVMSFLIGGDPVARLVFWIGAGVLSVTNIVLVWIHSNEQRYNPRLAAWLWATSTLSVQSAVYYFGPFSAVIMVDMLGIVFAAIGKVRSAAIATVAVCVVGHLAMTLPMITGWTEDRGVLNSVANGRIQLAVAELLIVMFLISGYALGRWARNMSAQALADLEGAMRVIGDQQQAMLEVVDAQERQKRVNEGRWTGQQVGSFKLGLVLGRGAMGEVYEAVGPGDQPAAVKLLNARATSSSSIVERFHREMKVAARLESPHIVRVFEVSPPDALVPYIAMEKLQGVDLATRLRDQPRMPSDELVVLIDQVARGLEVARTAGVVHRDLKPHNLFQHAGGTWKILDFGVSKVMDSEGTLTGEGIVGTPQYMAPEQASGGHVTHLADVYALGAIAYRCLTGRSPFKGKDLAELVYQVVHSPPVRPSALGRVSTAVEDVLAVAMAKDPRRRFSSALSFAQAFISARRGRGNALSVPDRAWT